ncbi:MULTISPECIES: hypothetical protein [Vitreoscilla]|uniref:Lipoprotein n=1 Tax=Vitreoscilla stercoraria TaxID=61 RepID=A0ABY4E9K3_VITST|nr:MULTISPECIES: hypothetical protein [Vitreoscilla]AUZ04239.2 hypothetical protein ADP71_04450 [Vitreoscilla sp. C1]UOO92008.1 hypothetical protein LVJ81_10290 [Vitreoscilla stercoraria]
MQFNKWLIATMSAWALSACASTDAPNPSTQAKSKPVQTNVQFDSYQEVAYQCQGGRVLALYGIKNNTVAGVQVVYDGAQSPLLLRTNNPKYNEFSSSGRHITWTQNLAAPAQVKSADARGLTRLVGSNPQDMAIGLVVEACKVDTNMTAKLGSVADEAKIQWLNAK